MRNLSPLTLDCNERDPGRQSQAYLLAPPVISSLFRDNFKNIAVERCIIKPFKDVKSSRMFASSEGAFLTKNTARINTPLLGDVRDNLTCREVQRLSRLPNHGKISC